MTRTSLFVAAALAAALASAAPAAEPSLLDQALDGGAPATQPATRPATAPSAATAPYSPDAARTVDNDQLVKDLTGQGKPDGPSLPKALQQALEHMDSSAQRLTDHDAGAVTQEHQRRVVVGLDELIDLARQQQSSGSGGQPRPGQQRERNPQQGQGQRPTSSQGGNTAAAQSFLPPGSPDEARKNGDIRETGTEWGALPPRDRDLIVHGAKEQALPSYRDLVNRYYQALAELGRTDHEGSRP